MGDVRVVWTCDLCRQTGGVDVRGRKQWHEIVDLINHDHCLASPECDFNFTHVRVNFLKQEDNDGG